MPEKERAIRSAQARAKRKVKKPETDKPVRTYGEKYTSRLYRTTIASAIVKHNRQAEKSGAETLPHWFPYQLRHTKATETRANGKIETLQILLGHSSIERYGIQSNCSGYEEKSIFSVFFTALDKTPQKNDVIGDFVFILIERNTDFPI